jgi:predicted RNA binding protein YcfA (HicA-like mRNA interferase family)
MPRLAPVSWNALVKRLRELGFEGPYAGGKHPQMLRDDVTLIIPNPHEGDIRCRAFIPIAAASGDLS